MNTNLLFFFLFFLFLFWFLLDIGLDQCDLGWEQQLTYKALNSLHHLIIKAFSHKMGLSDMNPIRHRKDLSLDLLQRQIALPGSLGTYRQWLHFKCPAGTTFALDCAMLSLNAKGFDKCPFPEQAAWISAHRAGTRTSLSPSTQIPRGSSVPAKQTGYGPSGAGSFIFMTNIIILL